MSKYILGLLLAAIIILYTIYRFKKQNELLSEIKIEQYNQLPLFSHYSWMIIILFIFSFFCLIIAIKENNYVLITVSIAIITESICEFIYNKKFMIFYYNDERCIIEGKQIKYDNIKKYYKTTNTPLSKITVVLYNGEKKKIYPYSVEILKDKIK